MHVGQKPQKQLRILYVKVSPNCASARLVKMRNDARSLPWSREQTWAVLRALARSDTVPYHETLMNAPFRGEEGPLRSMERADLITVDAQDGRPSTIRPGRPIYYHVFRRLVNGMFALWYFLAAHALLAT